MKIHELFVYYSPTNFLFPHKRILLSLLCEYTWLATVAHPKFQSSADLNKLIFARRNICFWSIYLFVSAQDYVGPKRVVTLYHVIPSFVTPDTSL